MTPMLYKKIYIHIQCATHNINEKKTADNLTSIKIGLSYTAYILLLSGVARVPGARGQT